VVDSMFKLDDRRLVFGEISFISIYRKQYEPKKIGIVGVVVLSLLSATAFAGEIHDAARAGDLTTVKALLEKDPKLIEAVDRNGATALHIAAEAGRRQKRSEVPSSDRAVPGAKASGSCPGTFCERSRRRQVFFPWRGFFFLSGGEGRSGSFVDPAYSIPDG
jgi:hypothetical protein